MNVLVVIPTYNERENLPPLVEQILEYPSARVLVVDDRSPDGTGDVADALARQYPERVEVLHRSGPKGLGRSLKDGLLRAVESTADLVFQMDADLSHDPRYIGEMVEAAADADLVIGSRYLHGVSVVNWPLRRIMLSAFANRYVRAVTNVPARDCTSGYRCWQRTALASLPLREIRSEGYSFLVEMLYLGYRADLRIVETPIIFVERRHGASKMSQSVMLESALTPLRLRLWR